MTIKEWIESIEESLAILKPHQELLDTTRGAKGEIDPGLYHISTQIQNKAFLLLANTHEWKRTEMYPESIGIYICIYCEQKGAAHIHETNDYTKTVNAYSKTICPSFKLRQLLK